MSTQTFNYTGGSQSWTVPSGVTSVTVDMAGAGSSYGESPKGGRLQVTILQLLGTYGR